jgi:hypothetical protein
MVVSRDHLQGNTEVFQVDDGCEHMGLRWVKKHKESHERQAGFVVFAYA